MRFVWLVAVALLLCTVQGPRAAADDAVDCQNYDRTSAERIDSCTVALEASGLTKLERATFLDYRGWARYERAEYPEAAADFTAAVADAGFLDRVVGRLMHPLSDDEAYDAADPYGDAFLGKASSEGALGKYQDAIADGSTALKWLRSPRRLGYAYNALGWIHRSMGDTVGAEDAYRESMEINPEGAGGQFFYSTLLFDLGRDAEALPMLRHAAALDSRYGYQQLWLYIRVPDHKVEGMNALRAYLAEVDGDAWPAPIARYYLGELDAEGVLAAAIAPTKGKTAENLCEAHYYIAEAFRIEGNMDEARRHYQATVDTGIAYYIEYQAANRMLAQE